MQIIFYKQTDLYGLNSSLCFFPFKISIIYVLLFFGEN